MKKWLICVISVILVVVMVGCGNPEKKPPEEQISYEIAMVTDSGIIMDGGYSEVAWNAISEFGAENGVSHKYYKASEATEEAYRTAIDSAVENGAKIIIADGYNFEDVVYAAQADYDDVKFVLIDAEPVNPESGNINVAENTTVALFSSAEAGYLAGYAAVENGFTQLGFMGDADKTVIKDYEYGFLQGAEAAAEKNRTKINVYTRIYTETVDKNDALATAKLWYEAGVEAIFACGTGVETAVIEAAEFAGKKVIACETDKSGMSDTVITSAVKNIDGVLKDILKSYRKKQFAGGTVTVYDASTEGVLLDMKTSRFTGFTEADYKDVYENLASKAVEIADSSTVDKNSLNLPRVTLFE